MKKVKLTRTLMAAVSVVAITAVMYGCTHDGDDDSPATGTEMPDAAVAERAAIASAITAAETAVGMVNDTASDATVAAAGAAITAARTAIADATNVPAAERAANTGTVNAIAGQLSAAEESRKMAMDSAADDKMKADAATGKALRAALGGAADNTNALANIAAPTLSAAGLAIDAAANAGALTTDPASVTLMAGDSAGSLGGWMGMDYAHMDTGTMVKNEARVYNNQGAPKSVTFAAAGHAVDATGANEGYLTTLEVTNVMADAFLHSGTQNHPTPDRADAVYVRGTYDGAPGEYRCSGADCASTNDGMGSPTSLGGTWHFKPDAGAMASQPDANYLYFGWWVSKDKDGGPTAASAFTGVSGTIAALTNDPASAVTGSATYAGEAAGKFAMSNPLDGTGSGGHFTADAMLTAKFGTNDAPNNGGVSGTIDNFRLNDGSEDPGWSVALLRAPWGGTGAFTTPGTDVVDTPADETLGTAWSIGGNSAPASGNWSGQMYDELPGNAPDGDGSDIPTTVTGTFYSEFSSIGRMVGAFGADKQ